MTRFELHVEVLNPKILKIWGKKIEAVDPAKIGGYAFEGDWISKNNSKGELFGLAPEGTLILAVMETGTNRHMGSSFLLCRVAEGEEDTWMGENTIHLKNLEIIEVLECLDGNLNDDSAEILKEVSERIETDLSAPLDVLKHIALENLNEVDEDVEDLIYRAREVERMVGKILSGELTREEGLKEVKYLALNLSLRARELLENDD